MRLASGAFLETLAKHQQTTTARSIPINKKSPLGCDPTHNECPHLHSPRAWRDGAVRGACQASTMAKNANTQRTQAQTSPTPACEHACVHSLKSWDATFAIRHDTQSWTSHQLCRTQAHTNTLTPKTHLRTYLHAHYTGRTNDAGTRPPQTHATRLHWHLD